MGTRFGYGEADGPRRWGDLDPSFALCRCGLRQSPIAIEPQAAFRVPLPVLDPSDYAPCDCTLAHNGVTVLATPDPEAAPRLLVGSTPYRLEQFHYHAPAEHRLAGVFAPLELHLVHRGPGAEILVVAVFVVPGRDHPELRKLAGHLPRAVDGRPTRLALALPRLLPPLDRTYRYEGSLTMPPCTEGVRWVVCAATLTADDATLAALAAPFTGPEFPDGNRRPLQPRNGRLVRTEIRLQASANRNA